ncbi:MAG: hypothetical protein E6767_12450 [Dysgonomonas sp.]|nr:hypothetical protein [Dysgonomonas sp.]
MNDGFNRLSSGIFIERRLNKEDLEQLEKHKRCKRVVITGLKADNLDFLLPMKGLQKLVMYSCTIRDWTALKKLGKLKEIFINGVRNDIDNFSFLSDMHSLEYIGIVNAVHLYNFPDLSECKNLQRLSIWDCKNLTDISSIASIPNIERFGITSKCIMPNDLEFIMQMPSIKYMSGAFGGKKILNQFMELLSKYGLQYG